MKKDFIEITKTKKLSKSKDNKTYNILKNRIIGKIKSKNSNANHHNTFTQKKILQKTKYDYSETKASQIRPQFNLENENEYSLKLDTKILSSVFKFNFENSLEPPKSKNETVLNFQKFSDFSFNLIEYNKIQNQNNIKKNEIFPPLFQYGAKFIINDMHKSLYDNIDNIIKLQSYLRGYLVKKKLRINSLNKFYFEKKSIKAIITLQKYIRGFLARIGIRKKIILRYIYQKRKSAIELIIKKMQSYVNVIKLKKIFFINYHLEQRKQKAIYIQETFRNYKFYKSFKKLKKEIEQNYFLDYPYNAQKVEIIICFDDDTNTKKENKKYTFVYNKLLKNFILLISPNKIFSGKYKCQFIVDDIIIFDKRYPTIQHNNGFYNIIDLIQKNKNLKSKMNQRFKSKLSKKNITVNTNKNRRIIKDIKKEDVNKSHDRPGMKKKCVEKKKGKLSNSSSIYLENLKIALEDIIEEEDEGRSVTSKDNRYDKKLNEMSDKNIKILKTEEKDKDKEKDKEKDKDKEKEENEKNNDDDEDDFDFTYEDYLKIKKIKNKNFGNSNYEQLKDALNEKKPINKVEKIRKDSLDQININN